MAIQYKNLEVEVSRCACEQWEVRILDSPINRPREPFVPNGEIVRIQEKVDRLDAKLQQAAAANKELAREIGIDLYKLLLRGKVRETFRESLKFIQGSQEGSGKSSNAGLRLRFSFGDRKNRDPRLANFPWELLCDPETGTFIGDRAFTPIVRYVELAEPAKRLSTQGPLKILAVSASPRHEKLHPVDSARHLKILDDADAKGRWLEIHHLEKATINALHSTLEEHRDAGEPFHGLHFLGHGHFVEGRAGEGGLCFEKKDGTVDIISGRELNTQLASFKDLRLVVLASCSGAKTTRQQGQNPFTGVASALIAGRLPAVVAMQFNISEQGALAFTEEFYERLGSSNTVDVEEAVVAGRLKIAREVKEFPEWATPVLFLRSPDGKVIDLGASTPKPKRISIFNIEDHGQKDLRVSGKIDLTKEFAVEKGRAYLRPDKDWNRHVLPELKGRLNSRLNLEVAYHLFLAAPISVAFAAGYLLEAKSGCRVALLSQRGVGGNDPWTFEGARSATAQGWMPEEEAKLRLPTGFPALDPTGEDLVVAVSASRPTLPAIGKYLRQAGGKALRVGHLIHAVPERGPDLASIENGEHAHFLATELINKIHRQTSAGNRRLGTIHLFIAAPNGLAYALGRLAKLLPSIQLYEYDFTGGQDGGYTKSIYLS